MSTHFRQGDIIVFKAEHDWLSKAIAWITKSDVSHTAMVYSENSIVEVGAYGIGVHHVETWSGKSVYVMRLSSEADPAPLIAAANKYLAAKTRYDFPALFLLAGLLIHNRIRPTARLIPAVNRILMEACLKLDGFIQHALLHHESRAMVCSQLIYQIYQDCGGQYQILLSDSLLTNRTFLSENSDTVCLADMITNCFSSSFETKTSDHAFPVTDETLKELYLALLESEKTDLILLNNIDKSLSLSSKFLNKLTKLSALSGSKIPLDAMFIAPCDFVYHTDNLTKIASLGLKRIPNTN